MARSDDLYKEGYLWFPPHGVLSQLKVNNNFMFVNAETLSEAKNIPKKLNMLIKKYIMQFIAAQYRQFYCYTKKHRNL